MAQRLGVAEVVDERVTLDGPGAANVGVKALTVIGSALAGGDCVDDVDSTVVETYGLAKQGAGVRLHRRMWLPSAGRVAHAHQRIAPRASARRHRRLEARSEHARMVRASLTNPGGIWQVSVRARLRRLTCSTHGVIVEAVPFARHGAP